MLRMLEQISWFWRWRRATVVLVAMAIALAISLATNEIASLSAASIILITTSSGTLTALLLLVDRVEDRREERDASFRRIRQYGERLAIYDSETGLYAYWYFSLRLQEEMARAKRTGQSLVFVLVEATRGRLGDEMERVLFEAMARSFRETDLVAHLGSLRFVALMPNTDDNGATVLSERLRANLDPVDVHIGRSGYPADGDDWTSLLRAAGASSETLDEAQRGMESVKLSRRYPLLSRGPDANVA
ncbi:MAG: diguanylate cyclase [Dehalococcoidia bacterium]|nr:diguanylate cyclase [Dehalococcoidia bacterium]